MKKLKVERDKNHKNAMIFCLTFFIISAWCLYGWLLPSKDLKGTKIEIPFVKCNAVSLLNGSYQKYLDDVWSYNFPGRDALIRTRNQMLYSILHTSSNSNVVMGKDRYLIDPVYIGAELKDFNEDQQSMLDEQMDKIKKLNALLKNNGKTLCVFISPSKASFYEEKIPNIYKLLDSRKANGFSYRERFSEALDELGVPYIDATEFIESHSNQFQAPVFYRTGDHWARTWGNFSAIELINEVQKVKPEWDLDKYRIEEYISDVPIYPDTDLYDSLNLWSEAEDIWYEPNIQRVYKGVDKPNVFFRGCSFMGQSLSDISRAGCFGDTVHLENNYCFTDDYEKVEYMSSYTAYEELPIDMLIGKSDLLILECNAAALENFSFDFVDYLLEHPTYLDYKYEIGVN